MENHHDQAISQEIHRRCLSHGRLDLHRRNPARVVGQSDDWFEQQRSLTNRTPYPLAASPRPDKRARGRVGVMSASLEGQAGSSQEEWLEQQLQETDGVRAVI
jgi:hypothetical protein